MKTLPFQSHSDSDALPHSAYTLPSRLPSRDSCCLSALFPEAVAAPLFGMSHSAHSPSHSFSFFCSERVASLASSRCRSGLGWPMVHSFLSPLSTAYWSHRRCTSISALAVLGCLSPRLLHSRPIRHSRFSWSHRSGFTNDRN